jgi:SAM-dependent methyltransferase
MEKVNACPVCNSLKIKKIKDHLFKYPGDEIQDHLDDIHYERLWILFNKILKQKEQVIFETDLCEECGFIFLNPRFTDEEMKIKYDTINELKGVKFRLEHDKLFKQENRAKSIYKLVNSFVSKVQIDSPKILDYGGASGYILEPFINNFDCNIVDFEKWELPDGIKYLGKQLSDLEKDLKFDVILLLHTLEHIVRPKLIIKEIFDRLSENGFLYVEVPLGAFQEWKYINDPLTHINYFSEQSLFRLFELCGFKIIHLSSAYQRVTRAKTWCLNILGTKSEKSLPAPVNNILSTGKQMNKLMYYLPFVFHKRAYKKILKKIFN